MTSVFEMIGPIMIGPSSSHMAGVIRIGKIAHRLMGGIPEAAEITFYNSLAQTYQGHGSAKAIIAGLLDFPIDDERVLKAHEHAEQHGLSFRFSTALKSSTHPNTVRVKMTRRGKERVMLGESVGGGAVRIISVDGYQCLFTGKEHTLVVYAKDMEGNIAKISTLLFQRRRNIANMTVNRRERRRDVLYVIEIDESITTEEVREVAAFSLVGEIIYIPSIY